MHAIPRIIALAAFALCGCLGAAHAADYPTHPIRLIIPFAAGGGSDTVARIIAKRVSETIGHPMVAEDHPGAAGNTAAELVAKAEPDGYTLMYAASTTINTATFKTLRYDFIRDFAPVTMTVNYPYVMVVEPKLPVKSVQDFVALAKSQPGAINYGTSGIGTAPHMTTLLFMGRAGLNMVHIPYRGMGDAVAGLMSGSVTLIFGDPVTLLPQVKAGTLHALAVTSPQRSAVAPDLPTVAESGYPGFDASAWHGVVVPAKTPPEIIKKLNSEIVAALHDPATRDLLVNQAMQPVGDTPEHFAAFIKKDTEQWKEVAAEGHISIQ